MSDCERKGKFFGGCKFFPRYEELPPTGNDLTTLAEASSGEYDTSLPYLIDSATKKVYIGEACRRCGKIVKANEP